MQATDAWLMIWLTRRNNMGSWYSVFFFWKELLLVTDVRTTWAEVIWRVKWIVFVRCWCYDIGWKTKVISYGSVSIRLQLSVGGPCIVSQLTSLLYIINWQTTTLTGTLLNAYPQNELFSTTEGWYTNLEQMPLNRCQPLLAPHKRLISNINQTVQRDF